MEFKKWFEAVATQIRTGGIDISPPDDEDDEGDDDEEWNWNNVEQKFGAAIQSWVDVSPCSQKVKSAILKRIFSTKPKLGDPDVWSEQENEIPPKGYVQMQIEWQYPVEKIESPLFNTLRNASTCDLWKAFKIEPKELWSLLDKGQVFDYVFYVLKLSLSGLAAQHFVEPVKSLPAHLNLRKQEEWGRDKLTISKYAAFELRSMEEKLGKYIEDYVLDMYNFHARERRKVEAKGIEVRLDKRDQIQGQIYKENFWARARLSWDYSVA